MNERSSFEIFGWVLLFLSGRTALWQCLQYFASRLTYFKDRKIFHVAQVPHQLREEMKANLRFLVVESGFWTALYQLKVLPKAENHLVLTFLVSFLWWELSYYVVHRALHHPRLFFLHKHHHLARVNTPLSGSSFSSIEGLLLLITGWGPLIVLGHYYPLSYVGAFAYNELLMCIRTTGHFNSEMMPPTLVDLPGLRLIQTNTFHALHHARFKGHYGLLTVLPDRWGNSTFRDYRQVHAHAYNKVGLKSLGQRFSPDLESAAQAPTPTIALRRVA